MSTAQRIMLSQSTKHILVEYDEAIVSLIPHAKKLNHDGKAWLAVKHGVEETRLLRNLKVDAPAPILTQYNWPGTNKPWQAQIATAALLTVSPRAYVLNEMGTGKTMASLWAADFLMSQGIIKRALIIAPLSTLHFVWANEIMSYMPHRKSIVLHGTKQFRCKALKEPTDFYIINHDGINVIEEELVKKLDIDLVIVDELAVYRTPRTKRWKGLKTVLAGRKYIWGMTGSPTPNAPTDAWAQVKLLTPNNVPMFFKQFREQTMQEVSQFRWIPRPNAEQVVHKAMQPAVRFLREQCLDLPPLTYSTHEIALTKPQTTYYNQMLKELRVEWANGEITAANEGVKLSKLLQIACGFIYGKNGATLPIPAGPRYEEVKEIIEQASAKVLVFTSFRYHVMLLETFLKDAGFDPLVVHGEIPAHERNVVFAAFKNDPARRVLIAHPGTMAHGLSFPMASTTIWTSPSQSLEIYEQANARMSRAGQKHHQHIIHLVGCPVERKVLRRLQARATMQGLLLELFKAQTDD